MSETQQQQTRYEKRWNELEQSLEPSLATEPRAAMALRGIVGIYAECDTIDQVRAATKSFNVALVPLAHAIATGQGAPKSKTSGSSGV